MFILRHLTDPVLGVEPVFTSWSPLVLCSTKGHRSTGLFPYRRLMLGLCLRPHTNVNPAAMVSGDRIGKKLQCPFHDLHNMEIFSMRVIF